MQQQPPSAAPPPSTAAPVAPAPIAPVLSVQLPPVHLSSSSQLPTLQHQTSVHVSKEGKGQEGRFRIIKTDKALPVNMLPAAEGQPHLVSNGLLNSAAATVTNLVNAPAVGGGGAGNGLSFVQAVTNGLGANPPAASASTTKYQKGRWHVVDIEFPNAAVSTTSTNNPIQTNTTTTTAAQPPIFTLGSTSTDALDPTNSCIKDSIPSTAEPTSITDAVDSGIHSRINKAMDLVKTHLTSAVKEEIVHLELQIKQLNEKCSRLEQENQLLKKHMPADTLSLIESRLSNLTIAIE